MIGIINHVDASVLAGFKTLHLKMKPTVRCSGQYFIQLFPPCNSWKMSLLVWPWIIAGALGLAVRKIMRCLSLAFIYLIRSYSERIDGSWLWKLIWWHNATTDFGGLCNTEINHSHFSFHNQKISLFLQSVYFPYLSNRTVFEVCFEVCIFFGHLFSFFLSSMGSSILLNSRRGCWGSPKRQEAHFFSPTELNESQMKEQWTVTAHPRVSAQLQWGVSHHATSDPQGRANAMLFHHKRKAGVASASSL